MLISKLFSTEFSVNKQAGRVWLWVWIVWSRPSTTNRVVVNRVALIKIQTIMSAGGRHVAVCVECRVCVLQHKGR